MKGALYSLWMEPRTPDPPAHTWRDWALVGVLIPLALIEVALRSDVVWPPVATILCLVAIMSTLWRRSHPLSSVAVTFGAIIGVDIAVLITDAETVGLYTTAVVLVLPYALFRWGSGRDAVIGLVIMLLAFIPDLARTTFVEAVAGLVILLAPMELGAAIRYRNRARAKEIDEVKMNEREQLARELHDTVAHHVSAIVIQAQAGRTLAASDPTAAVQALEVIEDAASRSLEEMRTMVGALRQNEPADLAPQLGVADIERLAADGVAAPKVAVQLTGRLDDLRPSVEAAIYRLAQESITNALRHARNATRIDVLVFGDRDSVRLTVHDDGRGASSGRGAAGFGLAGMTERASLLGGTLEAGPNRDRGWIVEATVPKAGVRS